MAAGTRAPTASGTPGAPLGARRATAELASAALALLAVCALWAALPSWLASLGRFQTLAALGFGVHLLVLLRADRLRAAPRAAALVLGGAVLFRLVLWPVTPTLSDDVYRYLWEGRVTLAGHDPYREPPLSPALAALRNPLFAHINHPDLSAIYPPLSLAGFALVAAVRPTLAAFKLWVILWDIALVAALLAWARREGRNPVWVAAYAWNPLVLAEYAGSGHNDPTALCGLALALAWERRRPMASATALAAAALTKLFPLAALPFLWRGWPWRARAWCAALLLPGLAWYGWATREAHSGLGAYVGTWRNNDLAFTYLERLLRDPWAARLAVVALIVALGLVLLRRGAAAASATRGMLRAGFLLGPTAHPWYLGWVMCLEPLGPSAPWQLLSLGAFLSYGVLRMPPQGTDAHLALAWRWVEYGVPLALALALAWRARRRKRAEE